ncbi:MAG: hypothetical protein AAF479_11975, partial [Pseudomonadota bacterium]
MLPFENLSINPEWERLGAAIAEDLITALSKFSQLAVISRTSSFAASRQTAALQDLVSGLDVEYVVEGSLRSVDDDVRVTVQLIHMAQDQHVWAGQFVWPVEGTLDEQFETTGVITGQVIDQI